MLAASDENLTGQQREKARVIHKAGNDLKTLIDNILDLSKIEARQLDVHCEDIDLPALLDDLHELMQPQYEQKGIRLEVELAPGAPRVIRSDPDKVRQILKNFIANALKFTDTGEVRVTAREAGPPYAMELAVSDTGIGIPKDKQGHIFDAFKQADGSTSRRYGGTGLGLTISRQLALLLKGDIRLRSELGQGATFSLLLPASCDHEQAQLPEPPPEPSPDVESGQEQYIAGEAEPDLAGLQVMLLEADVRTQLRLGQLFQRWNTGVLLACDTDEARETLDEVNALDVLVFEPQILGEHPCDRIKELLSDRFPGVLLIGLDGGAEFTCEALQQIHWLSRPVDAESLSRLLFEWKLQREGE
jgi:two-component sensor histidine kinase